MTDGRVGRRMAKNLPSVRNKLVSVGTKSFLHGCIRFVKRNRVHPCFFGFSAGAAQSLSGRGKKKGRAEVMLFRFGPEASPGGGLLVIFLWFRKIHADPIPIICRCNWNFMPMKFSFHRHEIPVRFDDGFNLLKYNKLQNKLPNFGPGCTYCNIFIF